MGLRDLFGGKKSTATVVERSSTADCVHGVRIPHWDSVADMGHDDRASYFVCESCGSRFTPEESAAIHVATADG